MFEVVGAVVESVGATGAAEAVGAERGVGSAGAGAAAARRSKR